jgi:hypothetical protein
MVHSACESGMTPRTMGGGSWWSGHAIHMGTSTGAMAAMLRSKAEGYRQSDRMRYDYVDGVLKTT